MLSNKGFTLLEAMTGVLILAIGIVSVATMQIQAIRANEKAFDRTKANSIAKSFLEELKGLPFDDPNLEDTNSNNNLGLTDGSATGASPNPALADHQFVAANFPVFANSYKLNNGNIVDERGKAYQIFWNVNKDPWSDGSSPYCMISLYVYWQTPFGGQQFLHFTASKYNNLKI